jgi:hypothetical protein
MPFLRMSPVIRVAAATLASLAALHATPPLAGEGVALKSLVAAREEVVRLSDLLPAGAPESVRGRLQKITLGPAPRPGVHRILRRADILPLIAAVPGLQDRLTIPDTVDVTRWSRPVTREELLDPILKSFRANRLEGAGLLAAADLSLAPPVLATEEAPRFEVTRIESAPNSGATRIHVWIVSEPRVPPFWVTLDREVTMESSLPDKRKSSECTGGAPCHPRRGEGSALAVSLPAPSRGPEPTPDFHPILVKAGQPVQLLVQGAGMRIATTAISLAGGREGDRIRVHAALSGKILVGTVVAPQTVEIDY